MAQNKVQYQRGRLMPEFFDSFGSPEHCEALALSWRWPRAQSRPKVKTPARPRGLAGVFGAAERGSVPGGRCTSTSRRESQHAEPGKHHGVSLRLRDTGNRSDPAAP